MKKSERLEELEKELTKVAALTKMIVPSAQNKKNVKNIVNWRRFTK